MYRNVTIDLNSQVLYKNLYQIFCGPIDENIPGVFTYGDQFQARLIHQRPEEYDKNNHDHSKMILMDDRYDVLAMYAQSGIKTIWYNPGGEIVNDELPLHDVDIGDLAALRTITTLLHKPSLAKCQEWWEEWNVPENIRRHSTVVARSVYVLAVKMRTRGISLDPILAHRAALLHDIDKIDTLEESGVHGVMGADFLTKQGFSEIAKIVRDHIMSTINHSDFENRSWENKLVFFCDKLVEGDELVPFDERLAALKIRYPHYVETMERAESAIWDLNEEICRILEVSSHEALIEMLRKVQ